MCAPGDSDNNLKNDILSRFFFSFTLYLLVFLVGKDAPNKLSRHGDVGVEKEIYRNIVKPVRE